jgi:HEAT repeat protein
MRTEDSAIKKKLRTWVPRSWHAAFGLSDRAGETRRVGAHGLAALGSHAPSAVPALIEIAKHHPDDDGRYIAVFAIRTLDSAAEPAIPFLIECLTNGIADVRDDAALGLGYIHRRPDIAVPALIEYLESHRINVGGSQTRYALDYPTPHVREAVTNWLPLIDAEAAAKAQVKRPR